MGSSQSIILSAHEHYYSNTLDPCSGGPLYLPSEILRICHPDRCWCSCPGRHPPKRYICCEDRDGGSPSYSDAFDGLHRLMCGQLAFENVRSPREWPEEEFDVVQEVVEDYFEWTCGRSSHGSRLESPEAVDLEMQLERFMRDVWSMMPSGSRPKTFGRKSNKTALKEAKLHHVGSSRHQSLPQMVVMGQNVQVNLDNDYKNATSKSRREISHKHRHRKAPQMLVQSCRDTQSFDESTDSDSTVSHDSYTHTHRHHNSSRSSHISKDWHPHHTSHRKVRFSSHANRSPSRASGPRSFSSFRSHHYDSGRPPPYHDNDDASHHNVYSTTYHSSRGRTHSHADDRPCRCYGREHEHDHGHDCSTHSHYHDLYMSGGLGSCSSSSSRSRSRERMRPGRSVLKRRGLSGERERWHEPGCGR